MKRILHAGLLMASSLAMLGLPAAAMAQILKCQAADGSVTYLQGSACPKSSNAQAMAARHGAASGDVSAHETDEAALRAPAAPTGTVPDVPLPLIETGVPAITQLAGRYGWLDAGTLALTTYSVPRGKVAWMVRRVVAYDVARRAATTLVARGFVDCVDASHDLASLEVGDLESRFAVGSTAAPAVQRFEVWHADTRTLAPAPAGAFDGWHPHACLKTAAADLAVNDLSLDPKPMRYLQPEHGILAWGIGADGHPEGPSWRHGARRKSLPLSINDISHEVRWLPFAKAYELAPGTRSTPMITMDLDGRVSRHALPATLAQALDAAGATGMTQMHAVRHGALVVQGGPARTGGGLYLVQGERSRRIWCTGTPAPGQAAGDAACAMSQPPQVAPDGCSVAFDAPPTGAATEPTFKVIELCSPAEKAQATRVSLVR